MDEIVRKNVSECLRFETVVRNTGRGPFELLFKAEAPAPGAYQIIYDRNGGARARLASASEYHPTHHHFHLRGFYEARLWRAGNKGMAGRTPVATGEKSGFCPEDGSRHSGGSERRYRCLADYRSDGIGAGQVVGISPGWSDAYRMHLPDQFIEVSGLQDGAYVLQITIDPDDRVRESDERDNSTCVLLELEGDDATTIGEVAACRR